MRSRQDLSAAPRPRVTRARLAVTALAAGLVLALAPATGAAAEPTGCPPGIDDPGLVTFDAALQLERVEGTEDAYLERLAAGFAAIDGNEDGALCLKAVSKLTGGSTKQLSHYYQAVDNTHPNK